MLAHVNVLDKDFSAFLILDSHFTVAFSNEIEVGIFIILLAEILNAFPLSDHIGVRYFIQDVQTFDNPWQKGGSALLN